LTISGVHPRPASFVVGESTLLRKLRAGQITQEEYEHISRLAAFERYRESTSQPGRQRGRALPALFEADAAEATAEAPAGAPAGASALAQRGAAATAASSGSASGAGDAAVAADAPPARALPGLSAEQRVSAFYAVQDPSKNVPLLLAKYEGRVDKLLARIAKRYGIKALEASYDSLLGECSSKDIFDDGAGVAERSAERSSKDIVDDSLIGRGGGEPLASASASAPPHVEGAVESAAESEAADARRRARPRTGEGEGDDATPSASTAASTVATAAYRSFFACATEEEAAAQRHADAMLAAARATRAEAAQRAREEAEKARRQAQERRRGAAAEERAAAEAAARAALELSATTTAVEDSEWY
jgi:hypothetical protein